MYVLKNWWSSPLQKNREISILNQFFAAVLQWWDAKNCRREERETSDATLISGSDLRIFFQISFADFLVMNGGFLYVGSCSCRVGRTF